MNTTANERKQYFKPQTRSGRVSISSTQISLSLWGGGADCFNAESFSTHFYYPPSTHALKNLNIGHSLDTVSPVVENMEEKEMRVH